MDVLQEMNLKIKSAEKLEDLDVIKRSFKKVDRMTGEESRESITSILLLEHQMLW